MSTYDESLLKDTQITRQERQEGYNVDLLNEKPAGSNTSPGPIHSRRSVHPPGRTRLQEEDVPPIPVTQLERKRPFWRTTKGLVIIAIVVVVIIGAVVGGAVGGTVSHKNNNKNIADIGNKTSSSSPAATPKPSPKPSDSNGNPHPASSASGPAQSSGNSAGSGGSPSDGTSSSNTNNSTQNPPEQGIGLSKFSPPPGAGAAIGHDTYLED